MADSGKILEKDIAEKKVYEVGQKIADSLKPASTEIETLKSNWLNAMGEIKQSIFDLDKTQKSFKADTGFKSFLENKQKQTTAIEKSNKALNAEKKAIEQIQVAYKEQERAEKNLITTIERKKLATESTVKALTKERFELQQLNKRAKEAAILSSSLSTEYEKQSVRLTQMRVRYKDLALTEGTASKEAIKLRSEIQRLDGTLKKVDAHVGQYQRSVGNYGKAMQGAANAARTMLSAMGVVGGAYLFVNVIRDAFNRVREFDKAMQNMAGITGKSRDELKSLEETIIRVAGSSIKTSNEVAELATALITLGKTPDEVEKLLKPTNDLAIALQASSEEAGKLLVGTLNAFGESANEAEKYANVIAKMRTSTALDFQQINDAMGYITPTARALGLTLEDTGAIVGVLADNNIRGERAGRLMSTALLRLSKNGVELNTVLDDINKMQDENASKTEIAAYAAKQFGAQAAPLALILANNRDKVAELTGELQNSQGTLDDLVNQQLESLDAKLKILDSTWEKFILSIEKGDGKISEAFKGVTDILTGALNGLIKYNETVDDTNKRLQDNAFEKTYQEQKQMYEDLGDSAERVAIQTADATRDTVEEIEKEIQALKDRNQEVESSKTAVGNFLRNLSGSTPLTSALFGTEKGEIEDNNKKLEELSTKLGVYRARLEAAESVVEQTDESQKDLNSTLDGATDSMDRNVAKIKELIEAEKKRLELSTTREEAKAVQESIDKLEKELEAILGVAKGHEKINKALEKRQKLLADDKFNYNKALLESELAANKEILDDEKETLQEKQLANLRYYDAKERLLQIQRDKELDESKGRADKLAEIQLKYNDDTLDLEKQREENALKLLKDYFNKELKLVQEAEQAKKDAQNVEIGQAQATFQNEVDANPKDLNAQLAAKDKYENTVLEIEKKYALLSIQVQIDKINAIDRANLTVEDIAQLEKQKADLEITYSNIATAQKLEDIEKEKEAQEKLAEEIAKVKEKLFTDMSEGLGEALNIDSSAINELFNSVDSGLSKLKDGLEETKFGVSDVLQTLSAAASVTRDIIGSVYEANIANLESQLDAMNEYYDAAYERAEGDQIQQDLIRDEQQQKEAELKQKIAKEKEKQAKADKTAALIQAAINTALGITSALANPGGIAGIVLAALVGVMGAVQIAAIASKPIPKFKEGHLSGTYEGWALTNDGGRDEVWERDGKFKTIKGRNVPIKMKKGDKIHKSVKSAEDYKELMRASILASVEIDNNKLKAYQAEKSFDRNYYNEKALREEMELTRKAIEKNRTKITVNQTKPRDLGHELYRLRSLE